MRLNCTVLDGILVADNNNRFSFLLLYSLSLHPTLNILFGFQDLGLAQISATNTKTPVPLGSLAHQIYRFMCAKGYAQKDFSSVFQFLREEENLWAPFDNGLCQKANPLWEPPCKLLSKYVGLIKDHESWSHTDQLIWHLLFEKSSCGKECFLIL